MEEPKAKKSVSLKTVNRTMIAVDEDKTVYLRSVWEMMKLIDAALQTNEAAEEGGEINSWK